MYLLVRHIKKKNAARRAQAAAHAPGAPAEHDASTTGSAGEAGHDVAPAAKDKDAPKAEPTPEARAELKAVKTRRRKYRWKLIAGLVLPFFLASVDLTIVASALPFVASYFGAIGQLNWIVTAYALTSTAFIPTFGQFADVFGRHASLQTSMGLMVVGSALCAGAQTFGMLLLGRAVQGLSAAGIMNIIKIVLADKVSLEDNAKNNTIFSLVAGVSYSVGPVIGGYLTRSNWRWCFVLSVPVAVISSILIFFLLRDELVKGSAKDRTTNKFAIRRGLATFDVGGTLLFLFGVGLIILGTAWAGTAHAWSSAAVLVPLIIGSLLFVAFWAYEYLMEPHRFLGRLFPAQVAMIPWALFVRRDTLLLAVINAATGAAMYAVFYFVGLYWTLARGYPADRSGVQLLFYIPGLGGGVYLAMFAANVWPRATFWPLWLGSALELLGVGLISWAAGSSGADGVLQGMMALAGAGTGLRLMPATLHAAGTWPERLAATISLMDFAQPFGGTLALTVMGAVFNNKIAASDLGAYVGAAGAHAAASAKGGDAGLVDALAALPPEAKAAAQAVFADAVRWAFVGILPFMGCCVIAATLLGNVWIRVKGRSDGASEVLYGSYLAALATGTVERKKVRQELRREEGAEGVRVVERDGGAVGEKTGVDRPERGRRENI